MTPIKTLTCAAAAALFATGTTAVLAQSGTPAGLVVTTAVEIVEARKKCKRGYRYSKARKKGGRINRAQPAGAY